MNDYFAYIRVSTVRQGEGVSLDEQRSAIEAYANRFGLTICRWFEEKETAAKLGRRVFMQMLGGIEAGQARGLIIHKIDRSARNLKDWAHLGDLIDQGVDVHFAHESLDMNTRGGRLAADIQAVVAADYVRNLREEVRKGFEGRLKQGVYPLPAPVGYLDCGAGKPKALDPVRAPLVRQAFDLYASGGFSYHSLAAEMRTRGLRSRTAKALSKNAIARMLRNPFYIGLIRIERTGRTYQGAQEALLTKRVFDRVQAVAEGRLYARVRKYDLIFRRLITCVACGRSLTGEQQKGHLYYRCHSRSCQRVSVREDTILARFHQVLLLVTLNDEEERDLRDLGEVQDTDDAADAKARRVALTQALSFCEDRRTRLTDALLDGLIDKPTHEDRNARLLGERKELLDALAEPAPGHSRECLMKKFELDFTPESLAEALLPAEKREMVKMVVSNLVVEGKDLGFRLRFPFDHVANVRISQNGAPRGITVRNGTLFLPVNSDVHEPPSFARDEIAELYSLLGKSANEQP